jgi:hypothetical protein
LITISKAEKSEGKAEKSEGKAEKSEGKAEKSHLFTLLPYSLIPHSPNRQI